MSDKDLESFDLNSDDSDVDSSGKEEAGYEFEVKKSQEVQEDFKFYSSFKVSI